MRSVPKADSRVKEAAHLGFKRCILPKKNLAGLSSDIKQKIAVLSVSTIEEAIHALIR